MLNISYLYNKTSHGGVALQIDSLSNKVLTWALQINGRRVQNQKYKRDNHPRLGLSVKEFEH